MDAISIGIAIDVSDPARSRSAVSLADVAEDENLDLVILTASGSQDRIVASLDVATVANWVLASTSRIAVGSDVPEAFAHDAPDDVSLEMAAKAQMTIDLLAEERLVISDSAWVLAPPGAGLPELADLARTGRAVVVPARSPHEVRRVAMLRDSLDGVTRTPQGRSVAAKSRRQPGIDYDGIPKSLGAVAIEPGDSAYRTVASTYLRGGSPGLVIQPRTPSEVADALAFARLHTHVPLG